MRDIARECHVSVATVSYVLNHSDKEKISHDTFLRVTETATRLHYVPSPFYAPHVGRKSNLVGIVVNLKAENAPGKELCYFDLAARLSGRLRPLGFETLLLPTRDIKADASLIGRRKLDAVFMIDVDNEAARAALEDCFVPILFLYGDMDDELFCKIYPDYPELFRRARALLGAGEPFLVMEDICSRNLKAEIVRWFPERNVFFDAPGADLHGFLSRHVGGKGIVLGDALALRAARWFDRGSFVAVLHLEGTEELLPDVKKLFVRNSRIAESAVSTLTSMLGFAYSAENRNRILLSCEE